ncbi:MULTISPECIES: hypothetical protein [unclassified Sphingomonas]|uniref:hypothetical protein n=1 Tax=unclassified Sphingomonas TaxID=196159 RepID=UPI002150F2AD|nr:MULTISPECIES: hypothetical protein [unclassified Sphingomonas]MCR5870686.1 hypothetical protein [Sphingomonas sp. J344]UUY00978.1 hypothetical protein LRS08_07960 [Sphingomonas sp. J315]
MTRTLLVDADLLSYRSSAATQKGYKWDGETVSVSADFEAAKRYAEDELNRLIDRLQPDEMIVCLSDDLTSFRKDRIDRTYKSARASTERPVYLYDVKDWLRSEYIVEERTALEADDVMGIIATDPSRTDERIIVSADKDMMTVPGLLYRPQGQVDEKGRPLKKPRILDISEIEAIRFHFWQTIVGDTTDGYPGAPGVGKLSPYAQDVLEAETEEEAWEEVLMAFAHVGRDEDAAIRQARLARILQYRDYDGRSPLLWLPPAYDPEDVN